jgi:hypothetical protein
MPLNLASRVAARYRLAVDAEWQKNWGWPDVPGYTLSKGHGIGSAVYRHTEGAFEVTFDIGGSTFKSDLAVRGGRGRWRTKAEIPVILESLVAAWKVKQTKAPKDPVETVRVNADEAKALGFIVHDGDRDGDLFSRSTTLEVATGVGWDTAKAYRVLNGLARKGVVVKGGQVPIHDTPNGYQGPGSKTLGWQLWHVNLDAEEGKVPAAALEQVGFKRRYPD